MWGYLTKVPVSLPEKTKLGSKMVDCIFIGYALNSSIYSFLVHKSEIPDIHLNMVIESRDDLFFENVFPYKWEKNNASEKRTHEITFRDEGPIEPTVDVKVEPRSKRLVISKFFGLNFVVYALESEPQIFKETTSIPKVQMWNEAETGS